MRTFATFFNHRPITGEDLTFEILHQLLIWFPVGATLVKMSAAIPKSDFGSITVYE